MVKVSVIVPMYNARDYIRDCVNGILSQTLAEVEVVVVNDASTDDSMEVCRKYFGGNARVQLVDQPKNMGPGEARNTGIQKARGDYIAFVDSDDAIRSNALECMYNAAVQTDADVLHATGVLVQTVDEAPVNLNDLTEDEVYHATLDFGEKKKELTLLSKDMEERFESWLRHEIHWAIWNKLYKRSFLLAHNIKFAEMKLAEDQVFCFHCLCHAGNYAVLPGEWYLYRITGDSLCRGKKSPAFMVKSVSSQIVMPCAMEEAMADVTYFEENPSRKKQAVEYVMETLEDGFVIPAFKEIGESVLKEDASMHKMFVDYFGRYAEFVEEQFYLAHKELPEQENSFEAMNSPAFWRSMKAQDA